MSRPIHGIFEKELRVEIRILSLLEILQFMFSQISILFACSLCTVLCCRLAFRFQNRSGVALVLDDSGS